MAIEVSIRKKGKKYGRNVTISIVITNVPIRVYDRPTGSRQRKSIDREHGIADHIENGKRNSALKAVEKPPGFLYKNDNTTLVSKSRGAHLRTFAKVAFNKTL